MRCMMHCSRSFLCLSSRYYHHCGNGYEARLNRESRNESGIGSKISGWSFGPRERRISLGAFQHFGQAQRALATCTKSELRGISIG